MKEIERERKFGVGEGRRPDPGGRNSSIISVTGKERGLPLTRKQRVGKRVKKYLMGFR